MSWSEVTLNYYVQEVFSKDGDVRTAFGAIRSAEQNVNVQNGKLYTSEYNKAANHPKRLGSLPKAIGRRKYCRGQRNQGVVVPCLAISDMSCLRTGCAHLVRTSESSLFFFNPHP